MCVWAKDKPASIGESIAVVARIDIEEGLRELGLGVGAIVLVHASLSSFGQVDGGAEAVVDAILTTIGPEGTLVAPTFTYLSDTFDPVNTPACTGMIAETVRLRPNAVRSLHPTHSVAAIGPLSQTIVEGDEKADTMGRGSALFKLLQANGKVLQLGVTHSSNSMIHVAEELAGLPYVARLRSIRFLTGSGQVVTRRVKAPGCSRGFEALEEPLRNANAIRETMIGRCRARMMSARSVVDAAIALLRDNPEALLCNHADCAACASARATIAATEAQKIDEEIISQAEQEERTRQIVEERLSGNEIAYFQSDMGQLSPN